jgi:hypothetical protein
VAIDEMWHTFVLFTKDYAAFCERYFGHFVHHVPTTYREQRAARRRGVAVERRRAEARIRGAAAYICSTLGEATFVRWYDTLARKYTPTDLERRRRRVT